MYGSSPCAAATLSPTPWSPDTSPNTPPRHRGHRPRLRPHHRRHRRPARRPRRQPHRTADSRLLDPRPRPDYQKLRRWAHMLGFGGHFLTKARRYSVTFGALRSVRIFYRRNRDNRATARPDPHRRTHRGRNHTRNRQLPLRRDRLENYRRRASRQHRRRPRTQTTRSRTRRPRP